MGIFDFIFGKKEEPKKVIKEKEESKEPLPMQHLFFGDDKETKPDKKEAKSPKKQSLNDKIKSSMNKINNSDDILEIWEEMEFVNMTLIKVQPRFQSEEYYDDNDDDKINRDLDFMNFAYKYN